MSGAEHSTTNPNSNKNKRKYKYEDNVNKNSQQGSGDAFPESSSLSNHQNKKAHIEDENTMVTNSLSNFLGNQDTSKSNENFLKEFSRNFYQKIVNLKDFNTFEKILSEWIKNIDKNTEIIFELMKNHEMNKFWFSSIIGFFYQFGLCCDVDDSKALEFYLLAVNDDEKEFLNHNFTHLHLNDNQFNALQNFNNII